jgi:O-antigen/teichoic acid export membrane protein
VAVAGVLAGIAMWCTAPWLAAATPGYLAQLRVLAVFLPAAVLFDTLLAATRGWRRMRPTVALDRLLRPGLQLAALALLWLAAVRAPAAYALAWVAPYVVTAVLAGVALRNALPAGAGRTDFTGARFWRFTGPRAAASVAHLALQRVDVLLLASLAGLKAAAVYAVAGRFVVLGQLANQAILLAVQPRLAELLGTDDRAGANAVYQTATGWLVLAAWPVYLGTAVFASVYLGLFGPAYRAATGVVVVLALAMLVGTGCGMVDTVLAMAGRTSWNLANVVLALAVNLGVDLALIPRLGALGAALGFAAATLTNNLVPLAQVATVLGLHPFGRPMAAAVVTATLCFGAVPLAVAAVAGATRSGALVAAALGAAGYAAALPRLRHVLYLNR